MAKPSKKYSTSVLFARSDFFIGAGSIFNIKGNYFSFGYSRAGSEADAKALRNDWGVIGQDMIKAIGTSATKKSHLVK